MQEFSGQTAVWSVLCLQATIVVYMYHAAKCQAAVEQPRLLMHAFALNDWLKSVKTNTDGVRLELSIEYGCFACCNTVLLSSIFC